MMVQHKHIAKCKTDTCVKTFGELSSSRRHAAHSRSDTWKNSRGIGFGLMYSFRLYCVFGLFLGFAVESLGPGSHGISDSHWSGVKSACLIINVHFSCNCTMKMDHLLYRMLRIGQQEPPRGPLALLTLCKKVIRGRARDSALQGALHSQKASADAPLKIRQRK